MGWAKPMRGYESSFIDRQGDPPLSSRVSLLARSRVPCFVNTDEVDEFAGGSAVKSAFGHGFSTHC